MPPVSGCFAPGELITVQFSITAMHKGHVQLHLCEDARNPTQACFDANPPLEFIQDFSSSTPAMKDPRYPERGYMSPDVGGHANPVGTNQPGTTRIPFGSGKSYVMQFKIPEGIAEGEHYALQWVSDDVTALVAPSHATDLLRFLSPSFTSRPTAVTQSGTRTTLRRWALPQPIGGPLA